MSEASFYVVGALFAVYVGAATWCSRDARRPDEERRAAKSHRPTLDRRIVHWWRARRRGKSLHA
jgi:hypothetical protein